MLKNDLAQRFKKIASFVSPGAAVADIGTDHASLPIYLVVSNITYRVICTEKNFGPYGTAQKRISQAGLGDIIDLRFGDGLRVLSPGEVDTAIIAGMGANTIIKIFDDSPDILKTINKLILNPANDQQEMRKWLIYNGWYLFDEELTFDRGQFNQIIVSKQGREDRYSSWNAVQMEIGPILIEKRHYLLKEYIKKKLKEYNKVNQELRNFTGKRTRNRLDGLEQEIEQLNKILYSFDSS